MSLVAGEIAIAAGLADHLSKRLPRAVKAIRRGLSTAVERAILDSPEALSLEGGRLQGELGVENPETAVAAIATAVSAGAEVVFLGVSARGGTLEGGFRISVLRTDLSEVLGSRVASFGSEGGYRIDWLRWLLTSGDSLVVSDYEFAPGPSPKSRTGLGLMRVGPGWGVPAEFAGTYRDNWLTRSLARAERDIPDAIHAAVVGVL